MCTFREYARLTMQAALNFKDAVDLAMRRAALCSLLVSLQALQYCALLAYSKPSNVSILDSLRNISRNDESFFGADTGHLVGDGEGDSSSPNAQANKESRIKVALLTDPLVCNLVEWVVAAVPHEHDVASKTLMQEILHQAIS